MARRRCLGCNQLATGSYCPACKARRESARNARRTHYSGDYRRRAREVREGAVICWLCGEGWRPNDEWQADHVDPGNPDSDLMPAHRSCNARRGNGRTPGTRGAT